MGLPLLASFREAPKRGSQSKGFRTLKPQMRLPKSKNHKVASMLLDASIVLHTQQKSEKRGRDRRKYTREGRPYARCRCAQKERRVRVD